MINLDLSYYRFANIYECEQGWALSQLDSTSSFADYLNNFETS